MARPHAAHPRLPLAACRFNLASAKNSVLRTLEDKANMTFKKFYNGPLFDRLLNTAMLYFTAKFMLVGACHTHPHHRAWDENAHARWRWASLPRKHFPPHSGA